MNLNWALFVDELGDRRILERLGVVPLGAGVDDRARGGFAVDGVNRQGDGLVADLVGVLPFSTATRWVLPASKPMAMMSLNLPVSLLKSLPSLEAARMPPAAFSLEP